jgi:hypothetical protein
MYLLIRDCCLNLTELMVPKSKERSTPGTSNSDFVSKSQIKKKKIHSGIKAVSNMHARPKRGAVVLDPTLAARRCAIDESATPSRRSDGLSFPREVGYDTLERVEQHAMTDVKGVPLASHDMHVRLQIYWTGSFVA